MKARASAKKRENPWHVHQFPGWLAAGRSGPAPSISAAPDEKGRVVKKRNETRKYFFFFLPSKRSKKVFNEHFLFFLSGVSKNNETISLFGVQWRKQ